MTDPELPQLSPITEPLRGVRTLDTQRTSRWLPIASWVDVRQEKACRACREETESLKRRFDRALARLWLACQPIVAWSQRRAVAFEVLCRSEEPGLEGPAELLAAAERLDQVWALGRTVRKRAAERLLGMPPGAAIFINLHPAELSDPDLFGEDSPLRDHAERVVFEVTERRGIEDLALAARRVEGLKELGYRVAIDDLGAGHSGLSSLAELAPDVVKIDRSLVAGMNRHPLKARLVKSVVELCKSIDAEIIAEGVETDEELEAVVEAGCDWVQGYLFGRPSSHPRG